MSKTATKKEVTSSTQITGGAGQTIQKIHHSKIEFTSTVNSIYRYLYVLKMVCNRYEIRIKNNYSSQEVKTLIQNITLKHHSKIKKRLNQYFSKLNNCLFAELELSQGGNKKFLESARKEFQKKLMPLFLCTDFITQIAYKPLGYAGDFRTLDAIYNRSYSSSTYGRLLDMYMINIELGDSVRHRSEYITSHLETYIKHNPVNVLSLASGPCNEMGSFDRLATKYGVNIDLSLLDIEKKALEFCEKKAEGLKLSNITYYEQDILKFKHSSSQSKYHLIYSLGLFDYLEDRLFSLLAVKMFNLLEEGGTLVIGNVSDRNPSRALLSLVGDWNRIHRNEQSLKLLTKNIDCSDRNIEKDTTGIQLYLVLKK